MKNILHIFAHKVAVGLIATSLIIGGWFGYTPTTTDIASSADISLGAYAPSGGGTYHLKTSAGISDTSIQLSSFEEPISNIPYTMSYLGTSIGYGTLDPQTVGRSEFISFSGITQNTNGSATLTGVARGLSRSPAGASCVASTTLAVRHPGQAIFILSDSPCHFSEYAVKQNDEVISGSWTVPTPTAAGNPTPKSYVDSLVNGGAVSTNAIIVAGTAGATINVGQIVFFNRYSAKWELASASLASTSQGVLLGIAQGSGTNNISISGGVLIKGLDTKNIGGTAGTPIYISNSSGATSTTAGTFEKAIGVIKSTTNFYFDPSIRSIDALISTGAIPQNYLPATSTQNIALTGTTTLDSTKLINLGNGRISNYGGTGVDGALSITSGTTNIDLQNQAFVVKNYTSISITGTGALTFSNPHNNGTTVFLLSQASTTLTSSAVPMISLVGIGAVGSINTDNANGVAGTSGRTYTNFSTPGGAAVAGGSGTANGGLGGGSIATASSTPYILLMPSYLSQRYPFVFVGGGGSNGTDSSSSGSNGGNGGRGGGALILETGGALTFTTTGGISTAGLPGCNTDGSNNCANTSGTGNEGGGGGGGGGFCGIFSGTISILTGTCTVNGGIAGTGDTGAATAGANGTSTISILP